MQFAGLLKMLDETTSLTGRHWVLPLALFVMVSVATIAIAADRTVRPEGRVPAPPTEPGQGPAQRREIGSAFRPPPGSAPVRLALFDADSTLRVAPSGKVSANGPRDVAILPRVAVKLAQVAREGYLIAIVSNQQGIEYGHVSFADADSALRHTIALLAAEGAPVHYYDFAEGGGEDRKPAPGMAWRLAALVEQRYQRSIDWAGSFMVGDSAWKRGIDREPDGRLGEDFSNTDRLFAEAIATAHPGFQFYHPRDFFGWTADGVRNFPGIDALKDFIRSPSPPVPADGRSGSRDDR